MWFVFGRSNAMMDDMVGGKKTHHRRRGLVREEDVASIRDMYEQWFRDGIEKSSAETISVGESTMLGTQILAFYQEGAKRQAEGIKKYFVGNAWHSTKARRMKQSVVLQNARCCDTKQWRNEDFRQLTT